jgi:hypothetical protein
VRADLTLLRKEVTAAETALETLNANEEALFPQKPGGPQDIGQKVSSLPLLSSSPVTHSTVSAFCGMPASRVSCLLCFDCFCLCPATLNQEATFPDRRAPRLWLP